MLRVKVMGCGCGCRVMGVTVCVKLSDLMASSVLFNDIPLITHAYRSSKPVLSSIYIYKYEKKLLIRVQ